jgi:hypothetical protein
MNIILVTRNKAMDINLTKEVEDETLISHIVLEGMKPELLRSFENTRGDIVAEVLLTVNGSEINLEKFCDHWQDQVNCMIKEEAVNIIRYRLGKVDDLVEEVGDMLQSLITSFETAISEDLKRLRISES